MANKEKCKQSVYIQADMLREIATEAKRQDRSLSWLIHRAWKIARGEIKKVQSAPDARE